MSLFPVLLVVHICLAVGLLLPSVLLPFLLRRSGGIERGPIVRALAAMQGTGSVIIGLGLAITGVGLLAVLGPSLLAQPWLMLALTIYALNLLVAAFISRPNLRRLLRVGGAADAGWQRRARRQRYVAYGMAAATGLIGFLMSTKPELW